MSAITLHASDMASQATKFAATKTAYAKTLARKAYRTTAQTTGKTSEFAARYPRAAGFAFSTAASSPTLYHATIKVVRKAVRVASKIVNTTLHATNRAIGWIGSMTAKTIGIMFPAAGTALQNATNTVTMNLATAADTIDAAINLVNETVFAASYAESTTKIVTRTGTLLSAGYILNTLTGGRAALLLVRVPVFGPYLAAGILSLRATFAILQLAWSIGLIWTTTVRMEQVFGIMLGTTPVKSFLDELKEELGVRQAADEVVAEAENIAKSAATEDLTTEQQVTIQQSVDQAVAKSEARAEQLAAQATTEATDTAVEVIEATQPAPVLLDPVTVYQTANAACAEADAVVKEIKPVAKKNTYPAKRNTKGHK